MRAANDNEPLDRLLRLKDVMRVASLGSSTIYRKMADGTFPRPLQLSSACVRWRESDIRGWMDTLPRSQCA